MIAIDVWRASSVGVTRKVFEVEDVEVEDVDAVVVGAAVELLEATVVFEATVVVVVVVDVWPVVL